MNTMFAILSDPAVILGVPATALLGWGIRELINIRERLTRIEAHLELDK